MEDKTPKICVVIPAHNEAKTLSMILRETEKYVDTVFVVDNGSNDGTAEIARENGFDYILQLDADGQHEPRYVPKAVEAMQNGDYDIVLGSRFLTGSYKNWSFIRRIGIIFFSKVISVLGSTKLTDVTSGFKVYKVSSLRNE